MLQDKASNLWTVLYILGLHALFRDGSGQDLKKKIGEGESWEWFEIRFEPRQPTLRIKAPVPGTIRLPAPQNTHFKAEVNLFKAFKKTGVVPWGGWYDLDP